MRITKTKLFACGAVLAATTGAAALAQNPAPSPAAPEAAAAPARPAAPRGPGLVLPPAPGGAMPSPTSPGMRPQSMVNGVQVTVPQYEDVWAVIDAIPPTAPAKPKTPRRVLIYSHAKGFAHSVIPLAAFTIKQMGEETGAYQADITYDIKDFNAANLARYDVLVLNSTTGAPLDDDDAAATAARHALLLSYVRSGHGLVLTHASTDAYHTNANAPGGLKSTWPEYTKMVGGFFKDHWFYPQKITVKIDDAKSPLNAALRGREYVIHDETYTLQQDSFSRKNVHVLTSIDYAKMSPEDKAKEPAANKRTDGDYALTWIRREGQGRVYSNVMGHSEHVLAMPVYLGQLLAGIQYAAGDLAADDSPSVK